jgi:hypothetical protein
MKTEGKSTSRQERGALSLADNVILLRWINSLPVLLPHVV